MPTQRISEETKRCLKRIQRELKEQKGEHHPLLAIVEKIVLNADLQSLYGLEVAGDKDIGF